MDHLKWRWFCIYFLHFFFLRTVFTFYISLIELQTLAKYSKLF